MGKNYRRGGHNHGGYNGTENNNNGNGGGNNYNQNQPPPWHQQQLSRGNRNNNFHRNQNQNQNRNEGYNNTQNYNRNQNQNHNYDNRDNNRNKNQNGNGHQRGGNRGRGGHNNEPFHPPTSPLGLNIPPTPRQPGGGFQRPQPYTQPQQPPFTAPRTNHVSHNVPMMDNDHLGRIREGPGEPSKAMLEQRLLEKAEEMVQAYKQQVSIACGQSPHEYRAYSASNGGSGSALWDVLYAQFGEGGLPPCPFHYNMGEGVSSGPDQDGNIEMTDACDCMSGRWTIPDCFLRAFFYTVAVSNYKRGKLKLDFPAPPFPSGTFPPPFMAPAGPASYNNSVGYRDSVYGDDVL